MKQSLFTSIFNILPRLGFGLSDINRINRSQGIISTTVLSNEIIPQERNQHTYTREDRQLHPNEQQNNIRLINAIVLHVITTLKFITFDKPNAFQVFDNELEDSYGYPYQQQVNISA